MSKKVKNTPEITTVRISQELSTLVAFERERRRLNGDLSVSKGDILHEAFLWWLEKTNPAAYYDYYKQGFIKQEEVGI